MDTSLIKPHHLFVDSTIGADNILFHETVAVGGGMSREKDHRDQAL